MPTFHRGTAPKLRTYVGGDNSCQSPTITPENGISSGQAEDIPRQPLTGSTPEITHARSRRPASQAVVYPSVLRATLNRLADLHGRHTERGALFAVQAIEAGR